jgi:hypothetical protein
MSANLYTQHVPNHKNLTCQQKIQPRDFFKSRDFARTKIKLFFTGTKIKTRHNCRDRFHI